ncbi:nucleoside triphosphate pyrophosphatase [Promethearchaeum syntrophicum]|uniref:Nucleoside triphosphate pyrophosphatase n=1 Tax=Promethearchaeum syntrophicum TaxID=2594042 RepID=A0A5B9D967_9ARCH|nr:nucleoside triphosphate pyrophosphatase [Candidatus Prometheoarchaeum syntrophicum]QEE15146.1 Maf-like protein [Candidatus Prometheoarchaeum syntrophicum]
MEKVPPNSIKLILASKSRDRKKLFDRAQIPVDIIPSDFDEKSIHEWDPKELVKKIAIAKAKKVMLKWNGNLENRNKPAIIIAADTMVLLDGNLIGKAQNKEQAFKILTQLSGKKHELLTGVAIIHSVSQKISVFLDISIVQFQILTPSEIQQYLDATDEYIGRAGAYSLYDRASLFIDFVEGSPTNVLGLPMAKLRKELQFFGVYI